MKYKINIIGLVIFFLFLFIIMFGFFYQINDYKSASIIVINDNQYIQLNGNQHLYNAGDKLALNYLDHEINCYVDNVVYQDNFTILYINKYIVIKDAEYNIKLYDKNVSLIFYVLKNIF